jgi:hypothetical protein
MPTDIFGPNHATSYFDRWLMQSDASALHLMKTYSVHPPDDAAGNTNPRGKNVGGGTLDGGAREVRHASMGNRKVARLHLTKGQIGQLGGNEGGDALYGQASYLDAAPGVPVYWLPWDSGGAIVELAIPQAGTRAGGRADPNRFFTAAINGCSVFISGTRQAPTIHHAGGDTATTGPAAQALFWRNLMAGLGHVGVAEANKEDYIKNAAVPLPGGTHTTQAARDYKTWLQNNYSDGLEIEDVRPWGAVMGIRDGAGDWTFYLQENASVSYYTLRKKKRLLKKSIMVREKESSQMPGNQFGVIIDRKRTLARPMRVSEIFPNRNIAPRVDQPIPRYRTA